MAAATGIKGALTRKLGPAPVWAWAIIGAAAVWFLFLRAPSASGQTTQSPLTASTAGAGSGAAPAADAGGGADGDLLAQLLQAQQHTIDSLTGAFVGGGQGATAATGTSGQAAVNSGAAPSSVQMAGPAAEPTEPPPPLGSAPLFPVAASQAAAYQSSTPASYLNADGTYSNFEGALPGWTSAPPDNSDVVSRYLANRGVTTPTDTRTLQVAGPTPTVVQPAPVDTSSIVTPTQRPTVGHNVAV